MLLGGGGGGGVGGAGGKSMAGDVDVGLGGVDGGENEPGAANKRRRVG
jgi:hypothetical protein